MKELFTEKKKKENGPEEKKYESIIETLAKIKGFTVKVFLTALVLQTGVLGVGLYLQERGETSALSPMETCYHGMNSIVQNAPDETLMDETTLRDTKGQIFNFERVVSVEVTGELSCDVVLYDRKRGPRLFGVVLQKSKKFARLYRIRDAVERGLP